MTYTVTLSNGKVFSGLKMSGDCFVSRTPVSRDMFDGGLSKVTVKGVPASDEKDILPVSYELKACEVACLFKSDGEYYFAVDAPDEKELALMQLKADIEYVAMMSEVEL